MSAYTEWMPEEPGEEIVGGVEFLAEVVRDDGERYVVVGFCAEPRHFTITVQSDEFDTEWCGSCGAEVELGWTGFLRWNGQAIEVELGPDDETYHECPLVTITRTRIVV